MQKYSKNFVQLIKLHKSSLITNLITLTDTLVSTFTKNKFDFNNFSIHPTLIVKIQKKKLQFSRSNT